MTFPQTQVIFVLKFFGCIPVFMMYSVFVLPMDLIPEGCLVYSKIKKNQLEMPG